MFPVVIVASPSEQTHPIAESVLGIEQVSYRYGEKRALDAVSFSLPPATFCALLGVNGAGKSTLFSLITRLFVTAEGRIMVAGEDLARHPRQALAKIGVVFQQPTLDLDLSVRRNLLYFAALQGLSGKVAGKRIDEALERLGLADRAKEKTRTLSGGYRRRTEIARALLHDPALLLLDEPTTGLDAPSRRDLVEHVHQLCAEGLTTLWATHLVDEIRPEDQVVVLHQGQLRAKGTVAEITGGKDLVDYFAEVTAK